ncbi:MAG: restriction endonuclease [Deltaproteobacteria bacterium]|nr:restriction endonuclease [Deltaproteobacteria bacterium]
MKKGRSLEKLVAYLEKHLSNNDLVTVESPKRLRDKSTGRLREHDVVLTIKSGHHTVLVAIECRDRSRPIGVPQLEGFAKKCQETGVGQGVIVSPCGFTKTARKKSQALGIRCLSLDQVNMLPWLLCEHIEIYRTSYGHIDLNLITENEFKKKPKHFILETDDGEEITIDTIRNNLISFLEKQRVNVPIKPDLGNHIKRFNVSPTNLHVFDSTTGRRERILQIHAAVNCTTELTKIPFILQEYRVSGDTGCIAQIAKANLDLGFVSGQLIINQKPGEGGGEIVFIRNDSQKIQQND